MTTTVEIITKIAAEIHAVTPGALGARRIAEVQFVLDRVLPEYSFFLGMTQDEVLAAIDAKRDINAPNYYQDQNFPHLDGVRVFDTPAAFKAAFPSGKFICPNCTGHSTDPYECTTGLVRDGKACTWKAYGLFRTAGKGMRVLVKSTFKESPVVHEIFMPVEAVTTPTGEQA